MLPRPTDLLTGDVLMNAYLKELYALMETYPEAAFAESQVLLGESTLF